MTQAFLRANRRTFTSLRTYRNYRLFFFGQVTDIQNAGGHLVCYAVRDGVQAHKLEINNQFGKQLISTDRATLL